jgi:hypothetical protein
MNILVCPFELALHVDWQDTSILYMPFLYRALRAIKVLIESKLPYEPVGIKTLNKVLLTSLFLPSRFLDS